MQWNSACMMFDQLILQCGIPSHLPPAHCCLSSTVLRSPSSSTHAQTSSWIRWGLSLLWALPTWVFGKYPEPPLPVAMVPNSAFCLRRDYATSYPFSALHVIPVLTSMPADNSFWSLESLCCRASLVHATIKSSVRSLNGSCKILMVLYSAELLRLWGKPRHL